MCRNLKQFHSGLIILYNSFLTSRENGLSPTAMNSMRNGLDRADKQTDG